MVAKNAGTSVPIHDEIIRWLELPEHPGVFALGCFARQVTFASQQTRALNLIWALFRAGRLQPGRHLGVVGAGLGGLTAAVAALTKGCRVDLFDQASQPCPIQRGNDNRFIHPNILRWPEADSWNPRTEFPFLNWSAANARSVIKQIELQWEPFTKNPQLELFYNYKVDRLYASPAEGDSVRPSLAANRVVDGHAVGDETRNGRPIPGYFEKSYDCVVLATGFGAERELSGVPFVSYWENDSFHQEIGQARRSILVSGCGDGGLIDALRLRLRNFDHADFTRQFVNQQRGNSRSRFVRQLLRIDEELRAVALAPDISIRFKDRYDALPVPKGVERYFLARSRSDTRVTLNSPAAGPLSFGSSLLNRYATYLAMRYADLRYVSGRITARRADDSSYAITMQRDAIALPDAHKFDLVIVRHGPQSVIKSFSSAAEVAELTKLWNEHEDPTVRSHWRQDDDRSPHRFFRAAATPKPLPNQVVIDLALTTFDSMCREFYDPETVQSVTVGEHEGQAGFIVTLKPGQPPRPTVLWANVPLWFVVASAGPAAQAQTTAGAAKRMLSGRVPLGAGVYNYSAGERLRKKYRSGYETSRAASGDAPSGETTQIAGGLGTVGCFARDKAGRTFLITTGDAVSVDSGARRGDRLFLEGHSPQTGHHAIATLHRIYHLVDARQPNAKVETSLSIVSARLNRGVVPDFDALPLPWRIERVRVEEQGRVGKVGRTSGFTRGTISAFELDNVVIMTGDAQHVTLDGCIEITGDAGADFSRAGDSGAVVIHEKGSVVGMIIAGSEGSNDFGKITIVYPLADVLSKWGMSIVPHRPRRSRKR